MQRKEMTGGKRNQGYTMIIVMCLMFLFMALALSMLFSSALLLARAEKEVARKQSRVSAVSFAEWMDGELKKIPQYDSTTREPVNLCGNIKKRLIEDNWPAYTGGLGHEEEVAVLTFTPKIQGTSNIRPLGDLEVKMYWETEEGGIDPKDLYVDLVVTVKAVVQDEQYSVTTRYSKALDDPENADAVWNDTWYVRGRE